MSNVRQHLTKAKAELRKMGLLGEIQIELVVPRYEQHFMGYDPETGEPQGYRWYDTEENKYMPDGFEPPAEDPDPEVVRTVEVNWPENER
jgi:hypothetical protein